MHDLKFEAKIHTKIIYSIKLLAPRLQRCTAFRRSDSAFSFMVNPVESMRTGRATNRRYDDRVRQVSARLALRGPERAGQADSDSGRAGTMRYTLTYELARRHPPELRSFFDTMR